MALTTNASFVPTLTEFQQHWEDVNVGRGSAGALVLASGGTVALAEGLKTNLQAIEAELQSRLNDAQVARGGINGDKTKLLFWFGRWAAVFDAYFAQGKWGEARPLAAQFSSTTEDFVSPMLDAEDLWTRFNALTGADVPPGLSLPIVLLGETTDQLTLAQFTALIAELRQFADDETRAESRVRRSRSKRNFTQRQARELMVLYRKAMPSALPSDNELQETLPRLTPAETGPAPEPVSASAVYVSGAQSRTEYGTIHTPEVTKVHLRGVAGPDWNEDDAVTIATHTREDPHEFLVEFGLTQPGTAITLKVVVETDQGRERASAPMTVVRV